MARNFRSTPVTSSVPPTYRRNNAPSKKSSRGFFTLLVVLVGIVAVGYFWVQSTANILVPAKSYTIEKNTNLSNLNDKLNLGVNDLRYKLYLRFFAPKDITIQAGSFAAATGTTLDTFLTTNLKTPVHNDVWITILPGWNMWDIDSYLSSQGVSRPGEFLDTARINFSVYQKDFSFLADVDSLEGFLYPDTYRIPKLGDADDAIRVMLREFDKKIGESYRSLDAKKAYQILILASIVEREERIDANQPIVAGILQKRYDEGIALGADATVCYGYQKTQKECTPSFVASVIRDTNPYNTRSTRGFPPTPIANFPLVTWNAALNPESSPYYYYLHDSSGQIHYGRTNDEHNENKRKYLQ